MTEKEYMQEQSQLRAICWNKALPESARYIAQESLKALVKQYRCEYPPLEGRYTYTKEQEEEARRHGF